MVTDFPRFFQLSRESGENPGSELYSEAHVFQYKVISKSKESRILFVQKTSRKASIFLLSCDKIGVASGIHLTALHARDDRTDVSSRIGVLPPAGQVSSPPRTWKHRFLTNSCRSTGNAALASGNPLTSLSLQFFHLQNKWL